MKNPTNIPTSQVALNLFNGSYAGMNFMYLYCIIVEGNLGKNSLSQSLFYKITLLYNLNALMEIIYH
jgi:hypothetical protein